MLDCHSAHTQNDGSHCSIIYYYLEYHWKYQRMAQHQNHHMKVGMMVCQNYISKLTHLWKCWVALWMLNLIQKLVIWHQSCLIERDMKWTLMLKVFFWYGIIEDGSIVIWLVIDRSIFCFWCETYTVSFSININIHNLMRCDFQPNSSWLTHSIVILMHSSFIPPSYTGHLPKNAI